MTLATSLRGAARNLITTFGNTASLYTYSTATKTENDEGDVSVSSWGSATSIVVVDGDNLQEELVQATQGIESIGEDDKIIRDDVTIAVNDRLTVNSVEFRVISINPVRTQDTLVVQIVKVTRMDYTDTW
ncbi:hypothetical protein CMI37_29210 [Candidatus Pacearchaeota archaeon]|jgi:hypothetical protein|nr:hypothetical protein [Candidatus Pacearchaeota archaeon]|tara:strand:- start:7978 stop:8367 length:390 start_codon:yes stop_codon:yes gene_type:complete